MAIRIGIMLRALDEKGGVAVYTANILRELLALPGDQRFVLYYRHPRHDGQFAGDARVTEVVVPGGNKATWDQLAIPLACRRHRVDVLFHPKFTAPLLAPCPVVMTVHGADWFIPDQARYYRPLDVRYVRAVMPWYFRKCATVISVSKLTTDNFNAVLDLPPDKVRTVYFAPARHFSRVDDAGVRTAVARRYGLPDRFILTLTKRQGDARKNLPQIFAAYARYHAQSANPLPLVIGGQDCHLFRAEYAIPEDGYGADIHFPGWLDQQDLPAIYSLATLYFYPSNLEAFPIPLTEAMACGTPIVTSNVNGLAEIAGDAALQVDPADTAGLAAALARLAGDAALRANLQGRGLARSKQFDWDRCARETLDILVAAANSP